MDIDPDRWLALLAAYRDGRDTTPAFSLLQEAQGRRPRANSDLEDFQSRGAVGRPDHRNPDMQASFKRGVDELELRLAEAGREVKRIQTLQRQASERRNALQRLIDGVREWAQAQSPPISLAGDDDTTRMSGFTAASVHVPQPAARAWP
ncbi:MAG TPA: hypothetical protein VI256_15025 [Roseiarcus sp.]|jgi:hypothetical protein